MRFYCALDMPKRNRAPAAGKETSAAANAGSKGGSNEGSSAGSQRNLPITSDSCLFCRIVTKEVPASIIFEDDVSMAFLDIRPLFPGHSLLIPKVHYEALGDLPSDLIAPLFTNAQILSRVIQDAMQAEGTFVGINNRVSQSVPHFHVHIVPRRKGDGLKGFFWPRRKYQGDELASVQETLSTRLRSGLRASSRE